MLNRQPINPPEAFVRLLQRQLLRPAQYPSFSVNRPPADWQRRAGRSRRTWLRTIQLDLQPYNLGSTQCGCVRRIVQSGVSLWRRLCSLMGALLDDNDDDDDDDETGNSGMWMGMGWGRNYGDG